MDMRADANERVGVYVVTFGNIYRSRFGLEEESERVRARSLRYTYWDLGVIYSYDCPQFYIVAMKWEYLLCILSLESVIKQSI